MRTATHVAQFILAAIIVIMLGGLAGWYFFIRGETAQIQSTDTARGFGTETPFSSGSNGGNDAGNIALDEQTTASPSAQGGEPLPASGFFSRIANTLTFGRWGNTSFDLSAGITDLLPFGEAGLRTDGESDGEPEIPLPPRLWRVSAAPAAGIGFIDGTTNLHFVERANGNVWSADPRTGSVVRITNTLMPKTYEALFSRDGGVVLRSVSESGLISTFAASATSSTSGSAATSTFLTLDGVYLQSNIETIAVHQSARTILYLTTNAEGTTATEATWQDGGRKTLFTSAIREWNLLFLSDRIVATQKASDGIPGFAFELKNGSFAPKLRNLPGLTYLPRADSHAFLFGTSENGVVRLYAQAATDATPVELPIRTTTEKCVWAPGKDLVAYCAAPQEIPLRSFLLDFYRGEGQGPDLWWEIDVSAGTAKQLPIKEGSGAAVVRPIISESGTHIAFLDARDMTIWVLRIAE